MSASRIFLSLVPLGSGLSNIKWVLYEKSRKTRSCPTKAMGIMSVGPSDPAAFRSWCHGNDAWLMVVQPLKIVTAGLAAVADGAWGSTTVTSMGDMI